VFAVVLLVQLVLLYWPRTVTTGEGLPWDKLVHALIFGLVMATGVRAGLPWRVWLAVTLAHAAGSELLQHSLLPNRAGDVWDAVADVVGTLIAAALVRERDVTSSGVRNPADEVRHARE
jgi:VanZ family protein